MLEEGKAVYGYNILIRETAASTGKDIFIKDILRLKFLIRKTIFFFAVTSGR
jgi:hypothetical protein